MASTAPAGAAQPLPQPSIPNDGSLSWEGDRMFNIYIYDYCHKRGFKKTARELLQEADIPADSKPPINARQGLLFESVSIFSSSFPSFPPSVYLSVSDDELIN
ncbi:hypothetical protein AMATHDRAFT_143735 [Amanita thiersii Skay4041]|uniref:Uncharacterized protein n=1 Tax=Amanita thiersii Skay4041 TaxID=703135 RepID=A0A2A9NLH5_9AGAR|nr:hypothetical protein AMATHDRAFT_143735 [Amanita thiersii Skay4041]